MAPGTSDLANQAPLSDSESDLEIFKRGAGANGGPACPHSEINQSSPPTDTHVARRVTLISKRTIARDVIGAVVWPSTCVDGDENFVTRLGPPGRPDRNRQIIRADAHRDGDKGPPSTWVNGIHRSRAFKRPKIGDILRRRCR